MGKEESLRAGIREGLARCLYSSHMTQRDFAKAIGVSTSTVNDWIGGKKIPRMDKIDKICSLFGVPRSYLLDRHEESADESSSVRIPVLGRVVAGVPIEAVEDVLGYEEIPRRLASTGEFFALHVRGDSMLPTLRDGDTVIVEKQSDVDSGDMAIVLINGEDATVKEIKKVDGGIMLIGHNAEVFKPRFFTDGEIERIPVTILGKVIESRRKY